jgi:hypothetical protein
MPSLDFDALLNPIFALQLPPEIQTQRAFEDLAHSTQDTFWRLLRAEGEGCAASYLRVYATALWHNRVGRSGRTPAGRRIAPPSALSRKVEGLILRIMDTEPITIPVLLEWLKEEDQNLPKAVTVAFVENICKRLAIEKTLLFLPDGRYQLQQERNLKTGDRVIYLRGRGSALHGEIDRFDQHGNHGIVPFVRFDSGQIQPVALEQLSVEPPTATAIAGKLTARSNGLISRRTVRVETPYGPVSTGQYRKYTYVAVAVIDGRAATWSFSCKTNPEFVKSSVMYKASKDCVEALSRLRYFVYELENEMYFEETLSPALEYAS